MNSRYCNSPNCNCNLFHKLLWRILFYSMCSIMNWGNHIHITGIQTSKRSQYSVVGLRRGERGTCLVKKCGNAYKNDQRFSTALETNIWSSLHRCRPIHLYCTINENIKNVWECVTPQRQHWGDSCPWWQLYWWQLF